MACRSELALRAAELFEQKICEAGVEFGDTHGVLHAFIVNEHGIPLVTGAMLSTRADIKTVLEEHCNQGSTPDSRANVRSCPPPQNGRPALREFSGLYAA